MEESLVLAWRPDSELRPLPPLGRELRKGRKAGPGRARPLSLTDGGAVTPVTAGLFIPGPRTGILTRPGDTWSVWPAPGRQ